MSVTLYLTSLSLPLVTLLLIFAMRYFAAVQQAKLRFAYDEAYRQLAEKAVATQTETAKALNSIEGTVSDISNRMTRIEKVLKGVE